MCFVVTIFSLRYSRDAHRYAHIIHCARASRRVSLTVRQGLGVSSENVAANVVVYRLSVVNILRILPKVYVLFDVVFVIP